MAMKELIKQISIGTRDAIKLNNQNSFLLEYRREDYVFILHDNRIFVFHHELDEAISQNDKSKGNVDISSLEQNIILNILTSTGIRALSGIYIVFRLFDNTALVSIIVVSLINGVLKSPKSSDLSLIITVGLEVFYDVMMNVNKYWSLQRLSVYIGIVLYMIYFSVLNYHNSIKNSPNDEYIVVSGVLYFRLMSFILEELTDIGIDFCIHNLLLESDRSGKRLQLTKVENDTSIGFIDSNVSFFNRVHLPQDITYKGSFNAWSIYSVKQWIRENKNNTQPVQPISNIWLILTFIGPILVSLGCIVGVAIMIFAAAIILLLFSIVYLLIKYYFNKHSPSFEDINDIFEELIRF